MLCIWGIWKHAITLKKVGTTSPPVSAPAHSLSCNELSISRQISWCSVDNECCIPWSLDSCQRRKKRKRIDTFNNPCVIIMHALMIMFIPTFCHRICCPLMWSSRFILEHNDSLPSQEDGRNLCWWDCIIPSKSTPTLCCLPQVRIKFESQIIRIRDVFYAIIYEQ